MTPSDAAVPTVTAARIDNALRESAVDAERVISAMRALLSASAAARFLWIHATAEHPHALERGALMLPTMALTTAFSLWMLNRTRHARRVPVKLIRLSVLADAVACTVALLSNLLWPWPSYGGVIRLPETITFVILVVAASFRVLPELVLFAAASATAGLTVLVALDYTLNRALLITDEGQLSLYAIVMTTTAALAYVHSRRTRDLIQKAAQLGASNARARSQLSSLMQGHHDATSLVSAALFSLENIARGNAHGAAVTALEEDLTRLQVSMIELKKRARTEAAALGTPQAVEIFEVLENSKDSFSRAVHPMRIEWQLPATSGSAAVAGGQDAFLRVLMNLLVNAKEGDGTRGASVATVSVRSDETHLWVAVRDNGPGMPQGWSTLSTKQAGSGTGCAFVERVVSASGGKLAVRSTREGAWVMFSLPWSARRRGGWRRATTTPSKEISPASRS